MAAGDNVLKELEQIPKNAKKYVVRGDANVRDIDSSNKNYAAVYGEIYAYDSGSEIAIGDTGVGNKAQITSFDTNGVSSYMSPDHTNDHIVVQRAGDYLCKVAISAETEGAGGGDEFGFAVYKNNGQTLFENLHAHRLLSGGGGDTGSVGLSGLIRLNAGDTIEVWVWNEDDTTNLVVDDITLTLIKLGTDLPKLAAFTATQAQDMKKQKIMK